ncbi:MAG: thioredoxin, partial [Alphaproteobacteria bacterium]|nr:thioredoxin [Alphaproteobacteria bacterium]
MAGKRETVDMDLIIKESAGGPGAADLVKDTDTKNFMADVVEASRQVPVIVDLWAPWCGPCKQLGPMLEKLVRQAGGKVRMVKVNVDENQGLATQLRVQSIPAVFAFKNGALVDGFVGAQPESQLKAFIQRLAGDAAGAIEDALAEARDLFDAGEIEAAADIYRQIQTEDPENAPAIAGLLRCLIEGGDAATAADVLSRLPAGIAAHAEITAIRTSLELAEAAPASGSVGELTRKVAANPDDHQARYDLAMAHYAAGDRAEAAEALLEIVRRDRGWQED